MIDKTRETCLWRIGGGRGVGREGRGGDGDVGFVEGVGERVCVGGL